MSLLGIHFERLYALIKRNIVYARKNFRMRKRALTSGRADDNEYTMRERLKTFHKHAEPVVEYFKVRQKLIEVDAGADAPVVYQRTVEGLKRMFLKKVAVVFVVGGPGCGKGTQCDRLKETFR